eukprot:TRINITY_DN402_c0_g1_i1.p1 TRINITY_DN402_c0_g1~~TRINITY_DN402_c0_g1_i1.p1  ORF type:complete len:402 (-),score=77.18 TRINITY_DN402_c0_g1_i1:156-1361(-)
MASMTSMATSAALTTGFLDKQSTSVLSSGSRNGLKSTCTRVTTFSVRASAEGQQQQQSQEQLFASVSQTTFPSSAATIAPVALAGVAVGAAAYALYEKLTSKPVVAPVPVLSEPSNGAVVPRAKRAAPAALATMAATFPNAMQEENFIKAVAQELFNLGFKRDNCIALVNTCRDEVCRPLVALIDREFGLSFNISGLGGLVNCGKTGFKAAMSHSPEFPCEKDGTPRERYVFFAFPHVSIGESGEVGSLLRRGRGKSSSACGALIAIKNDIAKGGEISADSDDAEYVLLKTKVAAKIKGITQEAPSLVTVTKAALQAITDDLELLIERTVDPAVADYAVITGVQIHSGNQIPGEEFRIERTCDYIAPNAMYAVIRGEKHILHCEVNQITAIKSISADLISV